MPFTVSDKYKHFDSFIFCILPLAAQHSPTLLPLLEYFREQISF